MEYTYTEADMDVTASKVLTMLNNGPKGTIVGLSGDLGAGKTTLVQAIARALGIKEHIVSPTFVIAKWYDTRDPKFQQLIHMDAYRIEDPAELSNIWWEDILAEPNTLVFIEWPERIESLLPPGTHRFHIDHVGDKRHIKSL